MRPYIYIIGLEIPSFGLMTLLGAAAAFGFIFLRCKIKKTDASDALLTACIALAGAAAGAKLLKPLIRLPDILLNWEKYENIPVGVFFTALFGETVFYGGLFGGLAAALVFCRFYKIRALPLADLYAPVIPLGHAFGRVGCLLAGCCYGAEVRAGHPFAIVYPERSDILAGVTAPGGVPLLAVPVIESAVNVLIAIIILLYERKNAKQGRGFALYGLLYGVQRFVLEFYRGDLIRGVYNGVSTSQIISLFVIMLSAAWFAFFTFRGGVHPTASTDI